MESKLEHVGIAVRSVADSAAFYGHLGLKLVETRRREESGVVLGFLAAADQDVQVELLEPFRPEHPLASFLAERGEGIHHLCFAVADMTAALAELADQGYAPLPGSPWRGSRGLNAYVQPTAGQGVVLELVQPDA